MQSGASSRTGTSARSHQQSSSQVTPGSEQQDRTERSTHTDSSAYSGHANDGKDRRGPHTPSRNRDNNVPHDPPSFAPTFGRTSGIHDDSFIVQHDCKSKTLPRFIGLVCIALAALSLFYATGSLKPFWTGPSWKHCAMDGQTCAFLGFAQVRFGADDHYKFRNFTDGVLCSKKQFGGDPAPRVAKTCDVEVAGGVDLEQNYRLALCGVAVLLLIIAQSLLLRLYAPAIVQILRLNGTWCVLLQRRALKPIVRPIEDLSAFVETFGLCSGEIKNWCRHYRFWGKRVGRGTSSQGVVHLFFEPSRNGPALMLSASLQDPLPFFMKLHDVMIATSHQLRDIVADYVADWDVASDAHPGGDSIVNP